MFGNNVERFLPGAYIQYVRFAGKGRGGEILREYKFSGFHPRPGAVQRRAHHAGRPVGKSGHGVVGAALDSPWSRVELISDGIHVHPAVVRATFKMFGPDRVILISDTMRAAGMSDGKYDLGGQEVTVKGPLATLADGTIAGSATDLMACLKRAVSFGIPLADAVRGAAVNSAKAIGIFDRVGSLEPGKRANVVVLDENLDVKAVFFKGQKV